MLMYRDVTLSDIIADMPPKFDLGNDGLPYAVFEDNCYTPEYCEGVQGITIAHFGNYENAVQLQSTIGL